MEGVGVGGVSSHQLNVRLSKREGGVPWRGWGLEA